MTFPKTNTLSLEPKQKSRAKPTEIPTPKPVPVFKVTQALVNARHKALKTYEGFNASQAESLSPSNVFVKLRIPKEKLEQLGLPRTRTRWEEKVAQEKTLQEKTTTGGVVKPSGQSGNCHLDKHIGTASVFVHEVEDENNSEVGVSVEDGDKTHAETLRPLANQDDQQSQTGHASYLNQSHCPAILSATRYIVGSSHLHCQSRESLNLPAVIESPKSQLSTRTKEYDLSSNFDSATVKKFVSDRDQQLDWAYPGPLSQGIATKQLLKVKKGDDCSTASSTRSDNSCTKRKSTAAPVAPPNLQRVSIEDTAKRARLDSLNYSGTVLQPLLLSRSTKTACYNHDLKLTIPIVSTSVQTSIGNEATLPSDLHLSQDPEQPFSTGVMAPVRDPNNVDSSLKDAIQKLYEVQSQVHGFVPETQPLLVDKMTELAQSLAHLQTLTSQTLSPNNPIHKNRIAPEVIDYVDDSRNPDIYNREFVELVQRGNAVMNGKQQAFRDFSEIFAKSLKEGMPELSSEVDKIMGNARFVRNQNDMQKPKDGGANGTGRNEWKSEGRKEADGETNGSRDT